MKVKIYINESEITVGDFLPRVLTEKQYQDKIQELVDDRLNSLNEDDDFFDYLADLGHTMNTVFFLSEEEKKKILEEFRTFALSDEKNEIRDYYKEYEIEI